MGKKYYWQWFYTQTYVPEYRFFLLLIITHEILSMSESTTLIRSYSLQHCVLSIGCIALH